MCLRKGCGRRYQPRRWNQHYCQDPECLRQLRRWQAAQRQARRRQDDAVKAEHAAAERKRRQDAPSACRSFAASAQISPRLRQRVVTQQKFFAHSLVQAAGLL